MFTTMPLAGCLASASLALLLAVPLTALAANATGCTQVDLPRPDFTGRATAQYRDCERRQGDFVKGRLVKGTVSYGDGQVKEGEFDENLYLSGPGRRRYANGMVVEGRFFSGDAKGQGKITYPDGKVYEGRLERSRPGGYGKFIYSDGTFERGYVTPDGNLFGFVVRKQPDGTWVAGEYREGKRFGDFVVSRPDRTAEVLTYEWGGRQVVKGAGGSAAATPPARPVSSAPVAPAQAAVKPPAQAPAPPAAPGSAASLPSPPVVDEVNRAVQGLRGLFGK